MIELTENEESIIKFLREARPFETITIQKDSNGKPDYYVLTREQKVFFIRK